MDWSPSAQERLVIITPNSEQIKYEFEHAFREWYKAHRGRDVMIDWRSPGGTSDIVRYINDRFEAEFRLYALENGLEWDRDTAAAFNRLPVFCFCLFGYGVGIRKNVFFKTIVLNRRHFNGGMTGAAFFTEYVFSIRLRGRTGFCCFPSPFALADRLSSFCTKT